MLEPLYDRIVVRRADPDALTAGGLHIPSEAQGRRDEAEVVAVGCGRLTDSGSLIPLRVVPGDRVVLGKFAGTDVEVAGDSCLIIRETEVLAIVRGEG